MREIFIKNRIMIFRVVGVLMLLVGFAVYFWSAPQEVISENDIAAANVARAEASVAGKSITTQNPSVSHASKIVEELQNAQEKQARYLMILTMIFGAGFVIYSFMQKTKSDFLKK